MFRGLLGKSTGSLAKSSPFTSSSSSVHYKPLCLNPSAWMIHQGSEIYLVFKVALTWFDPNTHICLWAQLPASILSFPNQQHNPHTDTEGVKHFRKLPSSIQNHSFSTNEEIKLITWQDGRWVVPRYYDLLVGAAPEHCKWHKVAPVSLAVLHKGRKYNILIAVQG